MLGDLKVIEEKFQEINTEGVKPMVRPWEIPQDLRPDKSEKNFTRQEILKNAPRQKEGYFLVPKTLKNSSGL